MKTAIRIALILTLFTTGCTTQKTVEKQINELLSKIDERNRNLSSISYCTSFEMINPSMNDSIFKVEGKVWLKPHKVDTIFGSVFHVRGSDRGGLFDYYYDGTKSYEIRHENKTIKMIDPYKYENNANNPAKARTALSPIVPELSDPNLSLTLRRNNPKIDLVNGKDTYFMTFKYPANEYGQEISVSIDIKKKTYIIEKIQKKVKLQNIDYKTSIVIDSQRINSPEIISNIYLQNTYSDYTMSELKRDNNHELKSNYKGLKAKEFIYPSSNMDSINLKSLLGKYVLLDFWETWCGHCILALPDIQKLQDKYKTDLNVIGITTENKLPVEKLLKINKVTYINIFADQQILNDYMVTGRPSYFLLDKKGTIIDHTEGDLQKIESDLKELL